MFPGHIIRSRLVCLALALSGGGAFAQVNATDSAFQRFYSQVTGVGKQTISFGSGGQPIVTQGVPQISSAGGPVLVDRGITLRNNSGGQLVANSRVAIPPSVLGQIIRRGVQLAPVLAVGVALYDLASEVGFQVSTDGTVTETSAPPGYDGREWKEQNRPATAYQKTRQLACEDHANYRSLSSFPYTAGQFVCHNAYSSAPPTGTQYMQLRQVSTGTISDWIVQSRIDPAPPQPVPSTLDDLADAIAARSGWPSSSAVSQAVADATAREPAPQFQATPEVTGPATSTGTTTTTENADGSTTTTTTTHNHTYTGPTINTTTQTISSTCTGGSCNTTITTETPKLDEQPFAMPCGVAGTPPCEVRLDQSGMPPDGGRPFDQASGEVDPERESLLSKLSEIEEFELGEWTWTFQLPTGCTPVTMFLGVEVNPCAWQAEIHDIMSVIWILTGIAGAFVIFSRAFQ